MADFEVSGQILNIALAGVILLTVGLIFLMRDVFKKRSERNLSEEFAGQSSSPLAGRNKYPQMDVFSLSGTFFNYALLVSLGLMILAFSWTQYEQTIDVSQYMADLEDEIEVEPPRTKEPPPPPPPPPPPVIEEVPEEEMDPEEDEEFLNQDIDEDDDFQRPEPQGDPPPPPPPPPPPEPEVEEIFKIVEEMPTFPGCEDVADKDARKKCADEKMLQYVYKNIKYPPIARENGVEGMVVIQFVVEKDGKITGAKIVRDIGAQCGGEALRVVNKMPQWNPGKQRGRAVRVQFNLPVRFKLE